MGDLARDAIDDIDFPRDVDHYIEIRAYLSDDTDEFVGLGADAWLEYAAKYPERIRKRAICQECRGEIYDLSDGLVSWRQCGDLAEIVHAECRDEDDHWKIKLDVPDLGEVLRDSVNRNALHPQALNLLEEELMLFGFSLTPPITSLVYFIERQPSGAFKIGYSWSLPGAESRRRQFQIACHPEVLRIKAVMNGDLRFESELKRRFAIHSLGGEWFTPHPDLLDFIAANARDPYDGQEN